METVNNSTKDYLKELERDQTPSGRWLNEFVEKYPESVKFLLLLLDDAGFATIGHAFAQRDKSQEVLSQFLNSAMIETLPDSVAKASLDDLKNNLDYGMRFLENRLVSKNKKDERGFASFIESVTVPTEERVISPDLQKVADEFQFGERKYGGFYDLNRHLDPRFSELRRIERT